VIPITEKFEPGTRKHGSHKWKRTSKFNTFTWNY